MVYEIRYFPNPGRADVLLLIAETGGVPYKFVGVNRETEWPTLKPSTRYGQLPSLKLNDNFTLYQTVAIARFLANEGGLYPSDEFQALQTEEYINALEDVLNQLIRVLFFTAEDKKEEATKIFIEGTLKNVFGALNSALEKNGGYLTGTLSWADLDLYEIAALVEGRTKIDVVSLCPQLPKLRENIWSNERAKAFLESERNLKNKKQQ
ncbi:hypothetical protein C9374_013461 [Naegleria lovaniensis]|uniref:Glutathione S-transferase n=1 Tax=Naegleria lovaniensis TaxID=51637 RepID=A0AA88H2Q9_NAELO|nr:uncharacterized protein C9374_013461 [Naegleria lovaniensis]KAG2391976.1 hypothetical protein C9374_013461 [Naegleria lovaniensis]